MTWSSCYELKFLLWPEVLVMTWSSCYNLKFLLWPEVLVMNWSSCYDLKFLLWPEVIVMTWSSCFGLTGTGSGCWRTLAGISGMPTTTSWSGGLSSRPTGSSSSSRLSEMAKVLPQLSSFIRVWPIPSHNLLEQLLKLDTKVYSSLCTLSLGDWGFQKCQTTLENIAYLVHKTVYNN